MLNADERLIGAWKKNWKKFIAHSYVADSIRNLKQRQKVLIGFAVVRVSPNCRQQGALRYRPLPVRVSASANIFLVHTPATFVIARRTQRARKMSRHRSRFEFQRGLAGQAMRTHPQKLICIMYTKGCIRCWERNFTAEIRVVLFYTCIQLENKHTRKFDFYRWNCTSPSTLYHFVALFVLFFSFQISADEFLAMLKIWHY